MIEQGWLKEGNKLRWEWLDCYDAAIPFGPPTEPGDSQYGNSCVRR